LKNNKLIADVDDIKEAVEKILVERGL